jgi:glycosyltransferase involved in cell wall biosynthesis
MKILQIVPSFHPAHVYGGPIESVYQLCRHLAQQGHDVRVLTTNANGRRRVLDVDTVSDIRLDGFRVRYTPRFAGDSVAPALIRHLPSYIRWADVVHVTAVYSFPVIPALMTSALLGRPVVWSPRGAFQRWVGTRRARIKTIWERICWSVCPNRLVLHFTSEMEAAESSRRCPRLPAAIVPNGVQLCATVRHAPGKGILRLLFLGRLDAKKGIENLIDSCVLLTRTSDIAWSLTVAGAGEEEYAQMLRVRIRDAGMIHRVELRGHVAGAEKAALFEAADVLLVPSHTENFGMVVAEALAHEVPVIASRGTPWERLEGVGCGLWTSNDPESLALAIRQIATMSRREMGERGRRWMEAEFSWEIRAAEMTRVYEGLTAPDPPALPPLTAAERLFQ